MKKLLPIIFILILSSCSKEIPSDQTVERNGITYEINSQTPFTGTTTSFYENGQLKERLSYKEGMKNGIQETFFSNGQLESKEELLTEYRYVGTKSNYYWDGQLKSRDIYSKEGYWLSSESYYDNGQLVYKSNILDKDGKEIIEPYVEFFRDGQVSTKFNLDQDENGTKEYYHSNGNLKLEFEVMNNEKHGPLSRYTEEGLLESITSFERGDEIDHKFFGKNGEEITSVDITGSWTLYRDGEKYDQINPINFTSDKTFDYYNPKYKKRYYWSNQRWDIKGLNIKITYRNHSIYEGKFRSLNKITGTYKDIGISGEPEGTWTMERIR